MLQSIIKIIGGRKLKNKRVTIADIAKQLGYSNSTVSRALNDRPGISESAKSEIRILAVEMGYDLKNIYSKRKKSKIGDVKLINIIVTKDNFLDENFFREIIWEIEQALFKKNIDVKFSIVEKVENNDLLMTLKRPRADGAIIFGLILMSRKSIYEAVYSGLPIVFVDMPSANIKVDWITLNNYMGCFDAASYLLQEGHDRITFIGDINFSANIHERYQGCKDCANQYGATWIEAGNVSKIDLTGNVTINKSRLKELMFSAAPPTAAVCANDRTAFVLYEALEELGLSVPEHLSVIGFDNVEKCQNVKPPLTSISIPKAEMGKEAVRLLLDRIANREKTTVSLRFDTSLTLRDSVKKINR